MTSEMTAAASGQFKIGGDIAVNRLGFGAMRVTGEGIWGEPKDGQAARAVLRALPALGVNFVDTSDAYGPFVSEALIKETLHPYDGMLIATKGGLVRTGPNAWTPLGRPAYLRQSVLMSMRRLGVERIDLWQLHRIDADTRRPNQFKVIAEMQKEGLIRHVGLSEVTVQEIKAAQKFFKVATVQNEYNLVNRKSEKVLNYCEREGIGFIPWFPLASGDLAKEGSVLSDLAKKLGASASQIALAWILKRSPVMLPIPGTSQLTHLRENVQGAGITLSDDDFAALDAQAKAAA